MDKILKFLKKLTKQEFIAVSKIMKQILADYRKLPYLKAIKGKKNWYRIRVGRYRIIFSVSSKTNKATIERITKRDEKTYKNLQ